jgi:hypothetical protein
MDVCMHKVLSILDEASNLLCFISHIIVVRIVEIVIERERELTNEWCAEDNRGGNGDDSDGGGTAEEVNG